MIPVTQALDHLFSLALPLDVETVPLIQAMGRVLARDVTARRTQPPFAVSAMDGYAVAAAQPDETFAVIGESAAGARFEGVVGPGQAVRIFTGAPVPQGAHTVVIQEDVQRDGDTITIRDTLGDGTNIRPAGNDFAEGATVSAPRVLTANDIALLAAMNIDMVPVTRRPKVAIVATGDELVMPGETPGPDQIVASNTFGLHAMLGSLGAAPRLLPIARDSVASLRATLTMASDADLIITVGGASVGDHDLVAPVAAELGMQRAFHKVAMRPGKPLMSGRLGNAMMIGLPGNPVSAMVCGHLFVAPVIRAMLGLGAAPAPRQTGTLAASVGPNGPREHYMRAALTAEGLTVFPRQDSSLLGVLAQANALVVRPPHDPARDAGDQVDYVLL